MHKNGSNIKENNITVDIYNIVLTDFIEVYAKINKTASWADHDPGNTDRNRADLLSFTQR